MTYMILDSHGNAVDYFEDFKSAAELVKRIVKTEPEAKDELVIMEYNLRGHIINACKYEDLISEEV